jgi:hypothetical protein
MIAGQSARAGGRDEVQLAVRLAPDAELQPVELVIVPAIQPKPAPAELPTTSAPAAAPTAGPPALAPSAMAPTPLTARPGQAAPMVLRETTPEARPVVSAGADDATAAGRHAAADARAADEAGPRMALPSQADLLGTADAQLPWATQPAAESPAVPFRRAKFDRLTAGMLDGVEAAPVRPDATPGASR